MTDNIARNIDDLMDLTAFDHRRAVELGNAETDPELRKRYSRFVELLNEAQQQLEPNYAPLYVDRPTMAEEPCPLCGQIRKVIKAVRR